MKPLRLLSSLLASTLVVAGALAASAPAHAAAGDIHTYPDLSVMAAAGPVVEAPDGTVWVSELENRFLHQYDQAGAHLNVYGPFAGTAHWSGMAVGPDGLMWVSQTRSLASYTSAGALATTYDLRGASPTGTDIDPGDMTSNSGMVWFTASTGFTGVVGMNPAGGKVFVTTPVISTVSASPGAARVWAAETASAYVGYIDPLLGTYSRFINPTATLLTGTVVAAPDGSAWVGSGEVVYHLSFRFGSPVWTSYALPTGTFVRSLDLAPNGDVWAGLSSKQLALIATDGSVTTFGPLPDQPSDVTVVGDRVWFSGGERMVGSMELLAPPTVTACPTATGTVGAPYASGALPATGSDPKRFSVPIGAVPPGLTLDTATGALAGTPTVAGTHVFTVRITGSMGTREVSYDKRCVVTIAPPAAMPPSLGPLVESGSAVTGLGYSATVTASGNDPITFAVTSGALPPGVTLASGGKVVLLGGTPTTAGTYDFEITATNGDGSTTRAYRIVVTDPAPTGTPPTLGGLSEAAAPTVGAAYAASVRASGDVPMTFAVTSGSLPPGVTMTAAGVTASFAGTPTAAGTYEFELSATNAAGADTKTYRMVVAAAPPVGTPPTLGGLSERETPVVGAEYEGSVRASGDVPMTFAVMSGSLPPGVTMTAAGVTASFAGTPTTAGTYEFELTATNAAGSDTKTYRIVVAGPPPVTPPTLGGLAEGGAATVGAPYDASVRASGGVPMRIEVTSGSLPPGVTVSVAANTASFTGTPTTAGTYEFELTATNAGGSDTKSYRIVVAGTVTPPPDGPGGGGTTTVSGGVGTGGTGTGGAGGAGGRSDRLASTGGMAQAPMQAGVAAMAVLLAAGALLLVARRQAPVARTHAPSARRHAVVARRHAVFTFRSGGKRRREG